MSSGLLTSWCDEFIASIDAARDSDVILSMARAGHPATRMSYASPMLKNSAGIHPSRDDQYLRRQIRGQSPQFVIIDEASEKDVIDSKATPPRKHCLKCNIRMADRGNSRRRRSAAKSDYCLECAKRLTPSDVTAALLSAVNGLPDDDLWKRTSKPRKDALDKTLDFLETLTGWTRDELRETAESIVSIANDRELGVEYKRMRTWMARQKSSDSRYATLWDQYRAEHVTSVLIGMESRRSAQIGSDMHDALCGSWPSTQRPRGAPIETASGLTLSFDSDDDYDFSWLRRMFEVKMNVVLDPGTIAILTGGSVISGC